MSRLAHARSDAAAWTIQSAYYRYRKKVRLTICLSLSVDCCCSSFFLEFFELKTLGNEGKPQHTLVIPGAHVNFELYAATNIIINSGR